MVAADSASMDYTEARDAFFQPREAGAPEPRVWDTPARALRDAIEPLATICFWSEPAYDAYAAKGLDFLQGYVYSRACPLGEPEPTVAAAAFGVFEPGLVASLYESGRERCSLPDVRAAKEQGAVAALREALGGEPADLAGTLPALEAAALAGDLAGRPLYAGLRALDWPEEPLGRLWHACTLLRELRGDGHLATLVAHGIDGVEANILTELWVGWGPLAYTASRAWSVDDMTAASERLQARGLVEDGALTEEGAALRERLEAFTDDSVRPAIEVLGDDLATVTARLAGWAEQVVERGWFPPDPYKRASG